MLISAFVAQHERRAAKLRHDQVRVDISIDTDDRDLLALAGGVRRLDRAERHGVIGAEDRHEIGTAGQRVVGDISRFLAVPVARE